MIKHAPFCRLLAGIVLILPAAPCQAAPPVNDAFANAALLTTGVPATGTNAEATMEPGEPVPPEYGGGPYYARTVWWDWTAPATGSFILSTLGSGFDTVLAVWTGTGVNDLTLVAEADGGTQGDVEDTSQLRLPAVEGTVYRIAVAGFGSNQSGPIVLSVTPPPPPPSNDAFANAAPLTTGVPATGTNAEASMEPGESVPPGYGNGEYYVRTVWWNWTAPATGGFDISTAGSGFDTVLAVWTGNGVNDLTLVAEADGGTNENYHTSRVRFPAQEGTVYRIAVAGWGADEQGAVILKAAGAPPPPANDDFANRAPLTTGVIWRGPTAGATREPAEDGVPWLAERPGLVSVWFTWTAPSTGWHTFSNGNPAEFVRTAVWTGDSPGSLQLVQVAEDTLTLYAAAGAVYQLAVVLDSSREQAERTLLVEPAPEPAPFQVTGFTVTPAAVEVSAADQTVQVVFSVKAAAPPQGGTLHLHQDGEEEEADKDREIPLTAANLTSGTLTDGTWTVPLLFARHTDPSTIRFSVEWNDLAGGHQGMYEETAFATAAAPVLTITNTGDVDESDPVLVSVDLSPATVEIKDRKREITVTVRATDDRSGVGTVEVRLRNGETGHDGGSLTLDASHRVSGTPLDGTYTGQLVVDTSLKAGTYLLAAEVEDLNGNRREYSIQGGNPPPGPFTGAVTVLKSAHAHLLSFTTSPPAVNVTGDSQVVTATFRLTLDGGVSLTGGSLYFNRDGEADGDELATAVFDPRSRIQGTDADGTYQVMITVLEGTLPGDYRPRLTADWYIDEGAEEWRTGTDAYGWQNPDAYADEYPWPAGAQQMVQVENTGQVDTEPPVLASVTVPNPVMARTLEVENRWDLEYSVTLADNVDPAPFYYLYLTDEGGRTVYSTFSSNGLLSVPTGAPPPGTYYLGVQVFDAVGNTRTYRSNMPDFPGPFHGAITLPEPDGNPGGTGTWAGWKAAAFTAAEAADATLSGETADPDGDGLTNLMEYALGLPPKTPDAGGPAAGTPEILSGEAVPAGHVRFRYTRAADPADLIFTVQRTDILTDPWTWTAVPGEPVSAETNGARRTVTWEFPITGAGFLRLQVSKP